MDKNLLIPIIAVFGSLLTVLITGILNLLVSLWNKKIDSNQKIKEHQLAIRSIYVNKKIDAAQYAIIRNSLKINFYRAMIDYLLSTKLRKERDKDLAVRAENWNKKLDAAYQESAGYTVLYYDTQELDKNVSELTYQSNIQLLLVENILDDFKVENQEKNIEDELNKAIHLLRQLENIVKMINVYIREDLSKYDII